MVGQIRSVNLDNRDGDRLHGKEKGRLERASTRKTTDDYLIVLTACVTYQVFLRKYKKYSGECLQAFAAVFGPWGDYSSRPVTLRK